MLTTDEDALLLEERNIPAVESLLNSQGIPFTESGGVVRCELKAFGILYGVVCIISAENLMKDLDRVDIALRRIQYRIFETEAEMACPPALYLFVVWNESDDKNPEYIPVRWKIEQNLNIARKLLMIPTDVVNWLRNPFPVLELAERVTAVPWLTTTRQVGAPASSITHLFDKEALLAAIAQDADTAEFETLKPIVSQLYRNVMGSADKVFWTEAGPRLGKVYSEKGISLEWCSSGEQTVFAFSIFLAQTAIRPPSELCLGFPGTFSGIDDLRQIAMFDCLRDFVIAIGASVVIQAPQNERRSRAIVRTRSIIEALGGQVVDRGLDFI